VAEILTPRGAVDRIAHGRDQLLTVTEEAAAAGLTPGAITRARRDPTHPVHEHGHPVGKSVGVPQRHVTDWWTKRRARIRKADLGTRVAVRKAVALGWLDPTGRPTPDGRRLANTLTDIRTRVGPDAIRRTAAAEALLRAATQDDNT